MPPYVKRFPVGTRVRVAARDELDAFRAGWHLHNPLAAEQLNFAGQEAIVKEVAFYHRGDPLYILEAVPGIWHEPCLSTI